ncbi:MAG: hypothetical protein WC782_13645 [Methylococcaceae bacterium]|jgi:hypothetical protein
MTAKFKIMLPLFTLIAMLTACASTRQLQTLKEAANHSEWQTIADAKVDCDDEDDACQQMHLLKGDACYRLAKQTTEKLKNYQCAAEQLQLGIQHIPDWKSIAPIVGKPEQYYENWCESLRLLRSEQNNNANAATYNQKLLDCAQGFSQKAETLQSAASFFLYNAELAAIRLQPFGPDTCPALRQLQHKQALATQEAAHSAYAENHKRLLDDITGIKSLVPGCYP